MGAFTTHLWVKPYLRKRVGWDRSDVRVDGAKYRRVDKTRGALQVIVSSSREDDGRRWLHVSASRVWLVRNRLGAFLAEQALPSYEDLKLVKREFVGEDKRAIQVFPPSAEHVNIHPCVLHLWHCVDGDGLPDFTQGSGSI